MALFFKFLVLASCNVLLSASGEATTTASDFSVSFTEISASTQTGSTVSFSQQSFSTFTPSFLNSSQFSTVPSTTFPTQIPDTSSIASSSQQLSSSSVIFPSLPFLTTTPNNAGQSSDGVPTITNGLPSTTASLAFAIPTRIQTLTTVSIAIPTFSAAVTSGSGPIFGAGPTITNPANPSETATFGLVPVPTSQENDLPDATDLAPAALILLFASGPATVLYFGGGLLVVPFVSATEVATAAFVAAALADFSSPRELEDDNEQTHPSSQASESGHTSTTSAASTTVTSSSSSALPTFPLVSALDQFPLEACNFNVPSKTSTQIPSSSHASSLAQSVTTKPATTFITSTRSSTISSSNPLSATHSSASPTIVNPAAITLTAAGSTPTPLCGDSGREHLAFPLTVDIPANADSLTIVMPVADVPSSEWIMNFRSSEDAAAMFTNWQVFANGPIPLTSGTISDKILWTSPNDVANTRLELLIKQNSNAQTFGFEVDGDAPCTKPTPTLSPQPTLTNRPNTCTSTPTAPGDLNCVTTNFAPRTDCGAPLLAALPFGTNGGLDQSNCIPGTTGMNASTGETHCSLAVHGQCELVAAFGAEGLKPQNRDDVAAVINDSNAFCFQVCDAVAGVVEASKITGEDGNVRLCVGAVGGGASC